jgi:hypothetical protein
MAFSPLDSESSGEALPLACQCVINRQMEIF